MFCDNAKIIYIVDGMQMVNRHIKIFDLLILQ